MLDAVNNLTILPARSRIVAWTTGYRIELSPNGFIVTLATSAELYRTFREWHLRSFYEGKK